MATQQEHLPTYILTFIALTVTSVIAGDEFRGQAELQEAIIRLGDRNTLNYGERCSPADERKRDELQIKLITLITSADFSQVPKLTSDINEINRRSAPFCKAYLNTQCNSTGFCDCANGDIMGIKVRSIRENGSCRIAAGSNCSPPELLPEMNGKKPDMRCEARTKCILKEDGEPCTVENLKEVAKGLKTSKFPICECSGAESVLRVFTNASIRIMIVCLISLLLS